jgi:hypothetical protein
LPLKDSQLNNALRLLESRALPEGGFPARSGEPFRSDATAWAILALSRLAPGHPLLGPARDRLTTAQDLDGRVSISREHEEVFWPTALSILAWHGSEAHETHSSRSVLFLLKTRGQHRSKNPDDPVGHDPSIPGWPWIDGTHSWIEPTALSVIALKAAGHGKQDRIGQAIQMILDRQLPHGGWNYGNTTVYGRELHPMPESTGAALAGLAGQVGQGTVARSLDYLQGEVDRLRTPISLGWGLLGLTAWDLWPSNFAALVERCLANQARYGEYDTSALSLLLLAALEVEAGTTSTLFPRLSQHHVPAIRPQ